MIKKFTATFAKNNFGVIVNEVSKNKKTVIIEKNGKNILLINPVYKDKFEEKRDDFFGSIVDLPDVKSFRKFRKRISL